MDFRPPRCTPCSPDSATPRLRTPLEPSAAEIVASSALVERAKATLGVLPSEVPNPDNPRTDAKVDLGRMLYYDARLSRNHDVSCNSCHMLDSFGVDNQPNSPGHRGQRGDRSSPTVYNAALHVAQILHRK